MKKWQSKNVNKFEVGTAENISIFVQNYTLLLKVKLMFYKCILPPEGKKKKKKSVQKAENNTTDTEVRTLWWFKMWATDGYSQKTP